MIKFTLQFRKKLDEEINFSRKIRIHSDYKHKHYLLYEIKHNIHKQCHVNYIEVKKFNYMLETDIIKNSLKIDLGVMNGNF